MKTILFLCTGNHYRSRLAEELFNFLAPAECPGWTAKSRGIAVDLGVNNVGPIAKSAAHSLAGYGIIFSSQPARMPIQLKMVDLQMADQIVALNKAEHLPLLQARFPAWLGSNDSARIEYWHINDIDEMPPAQALPLLKEALANLMTRLSCNSVILPPRL